MVEKKKFDSLEILLDKAALVIKKAPTPQAAIDVLQELAADLETEKLVATEDICSFLISKLAEKTGKNERWFRKYLDAKYKHSQQQEKKKKEKDSELKKRAEVAENEICKREVCGHNRASHGDGGRCHEKKCRCTLFLSELDRTIVIDDGRPLLQQLLYGKELPEDDPHRPVQLALKQYRKDAEHYDKLANDWKLARDNALDRIEEQKKEIARLEEELATRASKEDSEKIDLLKCQIEEYKAEVADLKDQLAKAQFTTADKILDFWIFVPRKKVGEIAATIDKMNWDKKQSGFSIRTDGKFATGFKVGEPT